ncbi:ABC transporter substrate-binding protein [Janibacter limosus]|uniref:ABC transporter substrate-binding protein n=1 Tax=Janibacter limosus TaxID=53458 RepID=UPI000835A83F|nr:sugar ABC transporter substrate-binding protein [Janibacter limosus]
MTTRAHRLSRALALPLTLVLSAGALAACSSGEGAGDSSGSGGAGEGGALKIALLLPESKTTRYESFDRPLFEAAVKAECSDCEVIYNNADQDATKQQQQFESAVTEGADVIVLDAVDGKSAASLVSNAKSQDIPVIAYDRFIAGADYYVSFDNRKVGELQGQALLDALKADGKTSGDILMINGAPTDANAADFKKGAHAVLDKSDFTIAGEYDTPDWSPDKAQSWAEGQLAKVKGDLVGVYAANDGTAGGAIAALKGGGVDPLPPVTGQDAELAAIQRIIAGDQDMTIYKAIKPEAEDAAKAAIALGNGDKPEAKDDKEGVPSTLLDPVVVTKDTVKDTIVKDGFYTVDDICAGSFAKACASAGLK